MVVQTRSAAKFADRRKTRSMTKKLEEVHERKGKSAGAKEVVSKKRPRLTKKKDTPKKGKEITPNKVIEAPKKSIKNVSGNKITKRRTTLIEKIVKSKLKKTKTADHVEYAETKQVTRISKVDKEYKLTKLKMRRKSIEVSNISNDIKVQSIIRSQWECEILAENDIRTRSQLRRAIALLNGKSEKISAVPCPTVVLAAPSTSARKHLSKKCILRKYEYKKPIKPELRQHSFISSNVATSTPNRKMADDELLINIKHYVYKEEPNSESDISSNNLSQDTHHNESSEALTQGENTTEEVKSESQHETSSQDMVQTSTDSRLEPRPRCPAYTFPKRNPIGYYNYFIPPLNIRPIYKNHQVLSDVHFFRYLSKYKSRKINPNGVGYCVPYQRVYDLNKDLTAGKFKLHSHILIMVGLIDLFKGIDKINMCQPYHEFIGYLKQKCEKIVLITLPPVLKLEKEPDYLDRWWFFNNFINSKESEEQVYVINFGYTLLKADETIDPKYFEADGVNLNNKGFRILEVLMDTFYFNKFA